MIELAGKNVTVIGAAKSGQAAVKLLKDLRARVKVSEQATRSGVDVDFVNWLHAESIETEFGGHTQAFVRESDLIVLSPGVRIDALPVQWAKAAGIPVWGEIELAARVCDKPIIAVTGSNGKTTVSTLIHRVLEASGQRACLCGNVGQPFTAFVLKSGAYDYFVVEISSFQLESIVTFKPHVAVFLNFSQNHLDRHKDLEEYFNAKKRIFLNQDASDFAVLNAADSVVRGLASQLKARVVYFNEETEDRTVAWNPNQRAVMTVAKLLNLPLDIVSKSLKDFRGVEHRMERVRHLDGVEYINDSKATTAQAGQWALQDLAQPVIMICGGRDKNIDFSLLRGLVKDKVKKMIVLGEAKHKLRETFAAATQVEECLSLADAVRCAQRSARPGDIVLLSPMCASFDMFKNFEERGSVFKEIVNQL